MAKTENLKNNLNIEFIKDFTSFLNFMPSPDEIMSRTGDAVTLYDEMLTDGRVSSLFYGRRNDTMNLPVEIPKTENKAVDAYMEWAVREKSLRKWGWLLLTDALKYGHRPFEIIWKRVKGRWVIDYLKGHNINQYWYDDKGNLFYQDMEGQKLLDQPFKWIIHRHEGDTHNNPQGVSILKSAYWAFKFKQMGFQFWVTATEKFSVPSILAIFEQSGDSAEVQKKADAIANMIADVSSASSGALANIKELKTIDMSGSLADFERLVNTCDVQIAYAITGQSLATNNPTSGTQALGTVHEATMHGFIENDARALSYTLQNLVAMAIELNFGPDAPSPEVVLDTGDQASWERVRSAIEAGVPVSRSMLYSRYRLPEPDDEADTYLKAIVVPGEIMSFEESEPGEAKNPEPEEPEGPDKEGAAVADTGAGVTLNGAQVSAATGIIKSVEAGELPRDSGVAQLKILFNLTAAQAEEMMGSAGKNPRKGIPPDQDSVPDTEEEFADIGKKKRRILTLIQ